MSAKVGRNDPCPCGSGRKFKHCCGSGAQTPGPEPKGHDGAVERALDWLAANHRKAVNVVLDELLFDGLDEEQAAALAALDEDTARLVQTNTMEWLLAEGEIRVKGEFVRVAERLLGRGGPLFTAGQRQWIEQLAQRPLRLYDVTNVDPGVGITLCDAVDTEAPPIVVQERTASQTLEVGTQIGVRIMDVDGHRELSGAIHPFSRLAGAQVVAELRKAMELHGDDPEELPALLSDIIREEWLAQFYDPPPVPTMVDALSGEPVMFVTDHYRVDDWPALIAALARQDDVEGTREHGWSRVIECEDGQARTTAAINPGADSERLSVFCRTQRHADESRTWFEALAGSAVRFITREIADPKGVLATMPRDGESRPPSRPPDLPPEVMADLVEKAILRTYAHWADEPIPALGGKTPRQAMQTEAGLERVKGLLRSYEEGEARNAREQGRREISYAFLWQSLGLTP